MTATTAAAAPVAGAATDKPWLQSYPPGVPATIDEAKLTTLAQMFRDSVRDFADRPAVESFGKRMSYAELGKAADAVASWLQGQGLKAGDRVAIMLPNVMAYPPILHGVLTAGYTVVNVNPLYTPRELVHQLKDAGARVLFVLENFGHTVEEALPELKLDKVVLATPGDLMGLKGAIVNLVSRHVKKAVKPYNLPAAIPFKTVLAEGRKSPAKPANVGLEDVAFLQYTGGTTGVAKGATLTHRNVAANVVQMDLWMKSCLGERPDSRDGHGAAALPHLRAHRVRDADGPARRLPAPDRESARHPGLREDPQGLEVHADVRRQHALQRARQQPGHQSGRFLEGRAVRVGRHGDASRGREEVEGAERLPDRRGLWALRDFAGGLRQPPRHRGVHRHDRLSRALDRRVDPRRRRQGLAAGRARRALRQGPAGHAWLLEQARGNREGHDRRRLFPHRRRRGAPARRQGKIVDR